MSTAFAQAEQQYLAVPEVSAAKAKDNFRTVEFIKDEALVEGLQALDTPDALFELIEQNMKLPKHSPQYISNATRISDILCRQTANYCDYIASYKGN